jgi:DNA-binding NarL/FixJ family response regulator
MIKVLIADDHNMVRKGLKQLLEETNDIIPVGEACNGNEVIDFVFKVDYDVLLLDITMPGMSSLDVMKQLRSTRPELKVLVLSMHPEEQYAVRFIRAGASGYLTKDHAPEELIEAIRKVAEGRKYISPSLAERLAKVLETGTEKPVHEYLSDREFQILCLIAVGKAPMEIADELSLSVKTISTYRARILRKMDMKTNAELMFYAIHNQLVV